MKPYKVHKTWVDLEHVISVEDEVVVDARHWSGPVGWLTYMFGSDKSRIDLGFPDYDPNNPPTYWKAEEVERAKTEWEAFKTAWMNKDKT